MTLAFSYLRWSTPAQGGEGRDSRRRQLAAAIKYAEKHGLTLNTDLVDPGISAFKGEHRYSGALASFLARVEAKEIPRGSFLLIDSVDRLSREKLLAAAGLWLSIAAAGINIVNLSSGSVFNEHATAPDMILLVLEIERSHRESAEKSRKVKEAYGDKRRQIREEGLKWSKFCPEWLVWNPKLKSFEEVPEHADAIRAVFDLYERGMGCRAIAIKLNKEGSRVPSGGQWHTAGVANLLKRRTLIGEYQPCIAVGKGKREPDGPPVPGYYPAVISEEQFYRVQAMLATKPSKGRGSGHREFRNLLQGIVRCHGCGGVVGFKRSGASPARKTDSTALACNAAELRACRHTKRIKYVPVEQAVLHFVTEWEIPADKPADDLKAQLAAAIGERESRQARVVNLTEAVASGSKAILAALTAEETALEAAQRRVRELDAQVRAQVSAAPLQSRQEALRGLLAKMRTAGADDLYSLRAAISQSLRSVIEIIEFHGLPSDAQYPTARGDFLRIKMRGDDNLYQLFADRNGGFDLIFVPNASARGPKLAQVLAGFREAS